MKKIKPLFTGFEWDSDLIERSWPIIDKIGKEDLGLDYYPPQFDICTSEQMLDAYSSIGMPTFYNHWSFGKSFIQNKKAYQSGEMNLAYELVINSNPCIAYLMEDNTAMMTVLVMAHANVGHASFFKTNYLFKNNTNPSSIVEFLDYAKKFVFECEEKHGKIRVENYLDICHMLQTFGVDRYAKPKKRTNKQIKEREDELYDIKIKEYNAIWNTLPESKNKGKGVLSFEDIWGEMEGTIELEEENLLRVIEEYSITLPDWGKEIVRINRKVAQYFYPQGQTKVMNEGWACFCHYYIMEKLYNMGHLTDGAWLEFIQSHTAVCYQSNNSVRLNPYALGFKIFMDLKRACLNPDEEDYKFLPDIAGKQDWRSEFKRIITYYKDESFVLQYLSPKVIRELALYSFSANSDDDHYHITNIQDDDDVYNIRRVLSATYQIDNYAPTVECTGIDRQNNYISLHYNILKSRKINDKKIDLLVTAMQEMTGYSVVLQSY